MGKNGHEVGHEGALCTECGSSDLGAVCRGCGAVLENARLLTIIEDQRNAIVAQALQMSRLERKLSWFQRDADKKLRNDPRYKTACRVLAKWAELCYPGAKELEGGERVKHVIERLKGGRTEEELVRCAFGYSRYAYVINGRRTSVGTPGQRRIDAELIFKDPQHVDSGLAFALEADRRDQVLTPVANNGSAVGKPESTIVGVENHSKNGNGFSPFGAKAIDLAERFGWQVFPVEPKGKHPVTQHGLLDATVDVVRIREFWLAHPFHNVAIRCGVESGLVVLDVDGTDGTASLRQLEEKYGALPRTASVVTPRGGQHYYFAHPGSGEIHNTAGFPGPGLDIRGDGGYVLAPPSVGPNDRAYEVDEQAPVAEMPTWLLKLLINRQSELPLFSQDYVELVAMGVRLGARNTQLTSLAGHLVAHGHTSDQTREMVLAINESRCTPPLANREVVKLVESVVKRERRKSQQVLRAIVAAT